MPGSRGGPRLMAMLDRSAALDGGGVSKEMRAARKAHRAVLIGFGPTGRTVERLLKDSGVESTVIELNIDTVREIRKSGVDAVYGDATRPETLIEAGIQGANNLILTSAGMAQQHRSDPRRARSQPGHSRAGAWLVPARPAVAASRRRRHRLHR